MDGLDVLPSKVVHDAVNGLSCYAETSGEHGQVLALVVEGSYFDDLGAIQYCIVMFLSAPVIATPLGYHVRNVCGLSPDNKMRRVAALWIIASVHDDKARGDDPLCYLVCIAMTAYVLVCRSAEEDPIPTSIGSGCPQPALEAGTNRNAVPKSGAVWARVFPVIAYEFDRFARLVSPPGIKRLCQRSAATTAAVTLPVSVRPFARVRNHYETIQSSAGGV